MEGEHDPWSLARHNRYDVLKQLLTNHEVPTCHDHDSPPDPATATATTTTTTTPAQRPLTLHLCPPYPHPSHTPPKFRPC